MVQCSNAIWKWLPNSTHSPYTNIIIIIDMGRGSYFLWVCVYLRKGPDGSITLIFPHDDTSHWPKGITAQSSTNPMWTTEKRGGTLCSAVFFTPLSKINHILIYIPSLSLSLFVSLYLSQQVPKIFCPIGTELSAVLKNECVYVCMPGGRLTISGRARNTHIHTHLF